MRITAPYYTSANKTVIEKFYHQLRVVILDLPRNKVEGI